METNGFIQLGDLEVYKLSRKLSMMAWDIYCRMDFSDKKTMGDQFIRAVDSVGANIAEGYGRYHYLDRVRFYYNSRGSHNEAFQHWLELLSERQKISKNEFEAIRDLAAILQVKLNNFISTTIKNARK